MSQKHHQTPDAILMMSPGCAHCPAVLEGLTRLIKEGKIGRLEVIDVSRHPEAAEAVGVRSVPWTRIGPFELEGIQSHSDLTHWAKAADEGAGVTDYYNHLLESGQLNKVVSRIRQQPGTLIDLLLLIQTIETPMAVRIGVGAVFEEMAGEPLQQITPELERLTQSPEPQVRADACHYLSLTASPQAITAVRQLLDDDNAEVREIASESLAILEASCDGN